MVKLFIDNFILMPRRTRTSLKSAKVLTFTCKIVVEKLFFPARYKLASKSPPSPSKLNKIPAFKITGLPVQGMKQYSTLHSSEQSSSVL